MRSIWKLTLSLLLLGTPLVLPATAQAQDVKARIHAVKEQIKADKKGLKDDRKDLKQIAKLRKKWEKAREKKNDKLEDKVDPKIREWLKVELAETKQERRAAERELAASGATVAPPPRGKPSADGTYDNTRDIGYYDTPAQADDRADLAMARADMRHTREIAAELHEIQGKFRRDSAGPPAYKQKSELLESLERAADRDVKRTETELAEDKAQLKKLKKKK